MTNLASTMVTLLLSNPALRGADLSSLRLLSCGGSPLPPANIVAAIAAFGCCFFVSYGMTECCGKIALSLPRQQGEASLPAAEQLALICTSGRHAGCHLPARNLTLGETSVMADSHLPGHGRCSAPLLAQTAPTLR